MAGRSRTISDTDLLARQAKLRASIAALKAEDAANTEQLKANASARLRAREAVIGRLATAQGLSDVEVWPEARIALVLTLGKAAVEAGYLCPDEFLISMSAGHAEG